MAGTPSVTATAGSPKPQRPWLLRRIAAHVCGVLCLLGVCLHLTVGDLAPFPWFVVYYALPRPLLCGLALAAQVLGRPPAGWKRRAGWVGFGALCAWGLAVDVGWHSPDELGPESSVRVAFWNAAGRPHGWEAASKEIASFEADVIGLVECGVATTNDRGHWQRWFPTHSVDFALPGLGLLVRGRILDHGVETLGFRSSAGWWDVDLSGRMVRVLVVDIASNPLQSRREALTSLGRLVEQAEDRPVIVMGDFNTPLSAPSLAVLTASGMSSASDLKGRGYRCTWPTPLPVLTLDQIWINSHVAVHSAGAGWSWNSDHRPVNAVVTFGTAAPINAAAESASATE